MPRIPHFNPWWPERSAPPKAADLWKQPEATDGGRTGTLTLSQTVLDANPTPYFAKLCSATFPEPVPCTVHIRCDLQAIAATGRRSYDFAAESLSGAAVAKLVFEYGAGSALRRVTCDLRPGSYQLPPCDQVTVYLSAEALPT